MNLLANLHGRLPFHSETAGSPNTESCGYWEEWLNIKLQKIDCANSTA